MDIHIRAISRLNTPDVAQSCTNENLVLVRLISTLEPKHLRFFSLHEKLEILHMSTRKIIKSTGTLLFLFLLVACKNENMPEILDQPQEWLLFEQNSENGKGIFRFDLEQASDELTPLLNDYQHIDWIYLSPDGQHAAIRVQDKINVRDLISGKQVTQLSAGIPPSRDFWFVKTDNLVVWSPTGDKLAFIQFSQGPRTDILLFDVINNHLISLTNDVALENALAWSPNRDQLAFATTQSCDKGIMDCKQVAHLGCKRVDHNGCKYPVHLRV